MTGRAAGMARAISVCVISSTFLSLGLTTVAVASSTNQTSDSLPTVSDVAPGDEVTNELVKLAPATRRRAKTVGQILSSLFGSRPKAIGPIVAASDYPWQVALRITANGKSWRCGGILISSHFVLTAAHCLDAANVRDRSVIKRVTPGMIEVFHGSRFYAEGAQLFTDSDWGPVIHPDWKTSAAAPFVGDAAVVRLLLPVMGATVAPMQTAPTPESRAVVSGWGRYDRTSPASSELRAVAVPLIDNTTCLDHLPADRRNLVSATSLCSEDRQADACKGDSGGPLVIGSRLRPQTIGIVSWGMFEACGLAGPNGTLIGGYTRASVIASWVRTTTGDTDTQTSASPEPLFSVNPIVIRGGIDR